MLANGAIALLGVDTMKIGFIGTGNMGSILIEAFILSRGLEPEHIIIHNRSYEKALKISERHPQVQIAPSAEQLITQCDAVFVCVRPADYKAVIQILRQTNNKETTIISITSAILLDDLEATIPNKIIKLIPSITNAALAGATLVMYSKRVSKSERSYWNELFATISQPIEIDERFVRVSSDLTSCGPAFLSFLLQNLIENAVKLTGISYKSATFLVSEMVVGYGKLISTGGYTLDSLQEKVCVPGGVTGVGLAVMESELGPLFEHLFQKTHAKYEQDIAAIKEWLEPLKNEH